jgi:hypothetical protein
MATNSFNNELIETIKNKNFIIIEN